MSSHLIVYLVLGIASIIYAFVLNTNKGRAFASGYTWASVVIGTSIVLTALWFLIPQDNWQNVVIAFIVAGAPMIVRSLINKKQKGE